MQLNDFEVGGVYVLDPNVKSAYRCFIVKKVSEAAITLLPVNEGEENQQLPSNHELRFPIGYTRAVGTTPGDPLVEFDTSFLRSLKKKV